MTTREKKAKKSFSEISGVLLFLFGGLAILLFAGNLIFKGISSKSWPKTTGRISHSEIGKKGGKVTVAKIRYVYQVNGRTHESTRVLFGPSGGAESSGGTEYEPVSVSWFTRRFPENSSQWVFYNPSRPSESVLLPGVTRGAKSMAGAGLMFFFVGLFIYFHRKSPSQGPTPHGPFKNRLQLRNILGLMVFLTFVGVFGYVFFWPPLSDWLAEKGLIAKTDFETALVGRKVQPPEDSGNRASVRKERRRDRESAPRKPYRRKKAKITVHRPEGCVAMGGAVEIYGYGFGSSDNRQVVLAGNGISVPLRIVSWGDEHILAEVPENPKIREAESYYFGVQQRKSEDHDYVWASKFYGVATCVSPVEETAGPEDRPFGDVVLVSDRRGVFRVDADGSIRQLSARVQAIDVCEGNLFALQDGTIQMLDADNGKPRHTVSIPEEVAYHLDFVVLPDLSFALLDNQNDAVYFIDYDGEFQRKVKLTGPDSHWQNLNGVVVKDALILCEDGNKRILRLDLSADDVSVLRDFSDLHNWLGAIDYDNGLYYLCQSRRCYTFTEKDAAKPFCILDQGVISGMAVRDGAVFLADRQSGAIYRINRKERRPEVFQTGFSKPNDIDILSADG